MFATRDQENLAFSHQHGASIKQQKGQTSRQLGSKTPGTKYSKTPMKVPLKDENDANAMASKSLKGGDKSNAMTPMTQRARAVLGDKTTNAKAKGQQTVNVKSTVREIEKSQVKLQNTVRPRQRDPQTEAHKLQVHVEETNSLSEDEIEYCPPRPKNISYKSNIFPRDATSISPAKPEPTSPGVLNFYFNPAEESGASIRNKRLSGEVRKVAKKGRRKVVAEAEALKWSGNTPEAGLKAAGKAHGSTELSASRKPLSTVRSKNAADVLSMDDDTTASMHRKLTKTSQIKKPVHKKASSFSMPALRTSRPGSAQSSSNPKKSAVELDTTSRTTIGYNKGRATASLLNRTNASGHVRKHSSTSTSTSAHRVTALRSNTTVSNDSNKAIAPAYYIRNQGSAAVAGDHQGGHSSLHDLFDLRRRGDVYEDDDSQVIKDDGRPVLHDESEDEFVLNFAH
ncbi:hypothetical protein F5X98DRAFT_370204 [Xylaria grammica]|nr:hypothetical protein F5X98DRAFT_370204 [Xylaria grammica]